MHRGASGRVLGDTGLTGRLVGRRTWGNNLGHFRPVRVNITNGHGHRVDANELSHSLKPLILVLTFNDMLPSPVPI